MSDARIPSRRLTAAHHWTAGRRLAPLLVAAALVVIGLWLAIAAGGGATDANAGYLQFYPGPLCSFAPAREAGGPGCPPLPAQQRR